MSKGNEEAKFAINFEGNASDFTKNVALSASQMQAKIYEGNNAIKAMNAALKNLKGSSAETADTKKYLQGKIDAERQSLARATVEMVKQARAESDLAAKTGNLTTATKAATESTKDFAAAGSSMNIAELAAGGAVAALVAVAAAAVAAGAAFAKFVVSSADAARTTRLFNQAAMGGNVQWAKNFSDQINALADKLPTSREEITKLGRELNASNIQGQAWVDSLGAISQASAALGDSAGGKFKSFIDRAMVMGRPGLFRLNAQDLAGTKIAIGDVSKALAEKMHVGVAQAQQALLEGRVKMADGAAALNVAVTKKFGGINAALAISLPSLAKKFTENLSDLTKDVDLEPLLKGFSDLARLFSVNSDSGKALKSIVEVFGKDLVSSATGSIPVVKKLLYGLVEGALDLTRAYLEFRIAARDFIDSSALKNVDLMSAAMTAGKVALAGMKAGLTTTALLLGAIANAADLTVRAFNKLSDGYQAVKTALSGPGVGTAIVDGLTGGLASRSPNAVKAVTDLADRVKGAFASSLDMHSPSKEFERFGKYTTQGYEQGIERGSSGAQGAVESMITIPSARTGPRAPASAPVVQVHFHVQGTNAKQIAEELSDATFLAKLTKTIADAANGTAVGAAA